jgi:hypothetical protein
VWDGVKTLIEEIRKCQKAGATISAVAMAYVCIDTMAFLSLPRGQDTQGRADFIRWVDTYLKGHADQQYQYRGLDVYGARCALLHAFSVDVNFHHQNPDAKRFGYHDGGKHAYDPAVDDHLVIIGTASLLNDLIHAVLAFMEECKVNAELRERVEERLPRVLANFTFTADGA